MKIELPTIRDTANTHPENGIVSIAGTPGEEFVDIVLIYPDRTVRVPRAELTAAVRALETEDE